MRVVNSLTFADLNNMHKHLVGLPYDEGIGHYFPNYCISFLRDTEDFKCLRIFQVKNWWLWSENILVGSIDCKLKEKVVDITFWWISDENEEHDKQITLDNVTSNNIKKILFDYADNYAKQNNCEYLQRDVHHSLREFNEHIKQLGFELNGKSASDHGAWLQSFKKCNGPI
jgi:hypothetical protein